MTAWYAQSPERIRELLERIENEPPPAPELGRGLLYRGQTHDLHGPSDAGKSLLAAAITTDTLDAGGRVIWFDWEQGAERVLRRLLAFGATHDALAERLRLVDFAYDEPTLDAVAALGDRADLAVIDAMTGLLVALGLGSTSDVDIEAAYARLLRPLARMGAAVLTIDHVRNNPKERFGKAIGSGRKMGAVDVSLDFEAVVAFKPGRGGKAKITQRRDRDGALAAVSEFVLAPEMTWQVEPRGEFRPTVLMQKVSEYLEAQTQPVSKSSIESDVEGKSGPLRKAIELLVEEEFVEVSEGPRYALLHTSRRAFRAASDSPRPTSSPTRRDEVTATTSSPRPSPRRGEREERDEVAEGLRTSSTSSPSPDEVAWLERVAATEQARHDEASTNGPGAPVPTTTNGGRDED